MVIGKNNQGLQSNHSFRKEITLKTITNELKYEVNAPFPRKVTVMLFPLLASTPFRAALKLKKKNSK